MKRTIPLRNYAPDQKRDEEGQWTVGGAIDAVKEKIGDQIHEDSVTKRALSRAILRAGRLFGAPGAIGMVGNSEVEELVEIEVEDRADIILDMILNYRPNQSRDGSGMFAEEGKGEGPSTRKASGAKKPKKSGLKKAGDYYSGVVTGGIGSYAGEYYGAKIGGAAGAIIAAAPVAFLSKSPGAALGAAKWGHRIGAFAGGAIGGTMGWAVSRDMAKTTGGKEGAAGADTGSFIAGVFGWYNYGSPKWKTGMNKRLKGTKVGKFDAEGHDIWKAAKEKAFLRRKSMSDYIDADKAYRKRPSSPKAKEAYDKARSRMEHVYGNNFGKKMGPEQLVQTAERWAKASSKMAADKKAASLAKELKTGNMSTKEVQKALKGLTPDEKKIFTDIQVRGRKVD